MRDVAVDPPPPVAVGAPPPAPPMSAGEQDAAAGGEEAEAFFLACLMGARLQQFSDRLAAEGYAQMQDVGAAVYSVGCFALQ